MHSDSVTLGHFLDHVRVLVSLLQIWLLPELFFSYQGCPMTVNIDVTILQAFHDDILV